MSDEREMKDNRFWFIVLRSYFIVPITCPVQ